MGLTNNPRNDIIKDLKISLDNIDANEAKKIIEYIKEKRNEKIFITKENLGSLRSAINNGNEKKSYFTNSDLKSLKEEFLSDLILTELDQIPLKGYVIGKNETLSGINSSLPNNIHINFNDKANEVFPGDITYIHTSKGETQVKRGDKFITIGKVINKDEKVNKIKKVVEKVKKNEIKEIEKKGDFIEIKRGDYLGKIINSKRKEFLGLKLTSTGRKTNDLRIGDKISINKNKGTFTLNGKVIATFNKEIVHTEPKELEKKQGYKLDKNNRLKNIDGTETLADKHFKLDKKLFTIPKATTKDTKIKEVKEKKEIKIDKAEENRIDLENGFKVISYNIKGLSYKYNKVLFTKRFENLSNYYKNQIKSYKKNKKSFYEGINFKYINTLFYDLNETIASEKQLKVDIDNEVNKITDIINKYKDVDKKNDLKNKITSILNKENPKNITGVLKIDFIGLSDTSEVYLKNKKDALIVKAKLLISEIKSEALKNIYFGNLQKIISNDSKTPYMILELEELIENVDN